MTAVTATQIILQYVCPILGVISANAQFLAPLKDLQTAVSNAQGLNGLNPTPWAFMLGHCIGWTGYALLINDYYLFVADGPGLLIACWLNMGAIKLMYSSHHIRETRKSLVSFLAKNDKKMEDAVRKSQYPKSMPLQEIPDDGDDSTSGNNDDDDIIPGYEDDDLKKHDDSIYAIKEEVIDKINDTQKTLASASTFDNDNESRDALAPLRPGQKSTKAFMEVSHESDAASNDGTDELSMSFSTLMGSKESSVRVLSKQKSSLSSGKRSSAGISFSPTLPEAIDEKSTNKSMTKQKSRYRTLLHSKSRKDFVASFRKRKEKMNEWGDVVWNVTSQQEPAKAPHEKLIMCQLIYWFVIYSALGFYGHFAPPGSNVSAQVVGYAATLNMMFFFGAPISRVGAVLKTKKCDVIHFQSLVANTLNNGLWFAYGIAPQINDPFLYGPCALGLFFCTIQFALCAVFPRTKEVKDDERRFSISSMMSKSLLVTSVRGSINFRQSINLGDVDLEKNDVKNEANDSHYESTYLNYSFAV